MLGQERWYEGVTRGTGPRFGKYPTWLLDDERSFVHPVLVVDEGGHLTMVASHYPHLFVTDSKDGGHTWSRLDSTAIGLGREYTEVSHDVVAHHRAVECLWVDHQSGPEYEDYEDYRLWNSTIVNGVETSLMPVTDDQVHGVIDALSTELGLLVLQWTYTDGPMEVWTTARRGEEWLPARPTGVENVNIEDVAIANGSGDELLLVHEYFDSLFVSVSLDLGETWTEYLVRDQGILGSVATRAREDETESFDIAWTHRIPGTPRGHLRLGRIDLSTPDVITDIHDILPSSSTRSTYKPGFVETPSGNVLVYCEYDHGTGGINLFLSRPDEDGRYDVGVQVNEHAGLVRAAAHRTHSVVPVGDGFVAAWNEWHDYPHQTIATRTSIDPIRAIDLGEWLGGGWSSNPVVAGRVGEYRLTLDEGVWFSARVYDVVGREVGSLSRRWLGQGFHRFGLDDALASPVAGVYLWRTETEAAGGRIRRDVRRVVAIR